MDDGNRVSADAPFWWTSLPQLHTFTLSSADALWLKGVREGALAVARTPWSDAAGRRTAQLGESQNYFVTMGTQNPDITCTRDRETKGRGQAINDTLLLSLVCAKSRRLYKRLRRLPERLSGPSKCNW